MKRVLYWRDTTQALVGTIWRGKSNYDSIGGEHRIRKKLYVNVYNTAHYQ
jgi:hypothetical protein